MKSEDIRATFESLCQRLESLSSENEPEAERLVKSFMMTLDQRFLVRTGQAVSGGHKTDGPGPSQPSHNPFDFINSSTLPYQQEISIQDNYSWKAALTTAESSLTLSTDNLSSLGCASLKKSSGINPFDDLL
jgi:hypothetical protein